MIKLITPLDQVDTSAAFTVGTRTVTKDGDEYIYLPGENSVAQYDWVTYITASGSSYGSVTRLPTANVVGSVAIAQAAITGSSWGWFQIKGTAVGNCGSSVSSGSVVYASGTVALVATQILGNEIILGAFATGTGTSGGTTTFILNYPFATATLD